MMLSINPKVTVLMSVYNAEAFLKEAIDSILNQAFTDFEFIIIDDGSTDQSESIICTYTDPRIVLIKNENNQGLVKSLNIGIDLAKGQYIARMDADDISLSTRLEKQVQFMDQHPEVAVCGTAYQYFGDSNKVKKPPFDPAISFTYLASAPSVGHPTAMIRKDILAMPKIRYEERFKYAADYAFWIRISQKGAIVSLSETLLLYRWHQNNMSKYDSSREEALVAARTLWYETLLGRGISESEKCYLKGNNTDWPTLMGGRSLIEGIGKLSDPDNLDKEYFGKLIISDWERRIIMTYPLKGLLFCKRNVSTRRWSGASYLGLCYWFIESLIKSLFLKKTSPIK